MEAKTPSESTVACGECKVFLCQSGKKTKHNPTGGYGCWEKWHATLMDEINEGTAKGTTWAKKAKNEWKSAVADTEYLLGRENEILRGSV